MPASDTTERPGSVPPASKPRARLTGPGNEAFELDDLEWIGERDFARQIVVEPHAAQAPMMARGPRRPDSVR